MCRWGGRHPGARRGPRLVGATAREKIWVHDLQGGLVFSCQGATGHVCAACPACGLKLLLLLSTHPCRPTATRVCFGCRTQPCAPTHHNRVALACVAVYVHPPLAHEGRVDKLRGMQVVCGEPHAQQQAGGAGTGSRLACRIGPGKQQRGAADATARAACASALDQVTGRVAEAQTRGKPAGSPSAAHPGHPVVATHPRRSAASTPGSP